MEHTFLNECDLVAVDSNQSTEAAVCGLTNLHNAFNRCFATKNGMNSFCKLVARFLLYSIQSENRSLMWNDFNLDASHAWVFGFQEHRVYPEKHFCETFECLSRILHLKDSSLGPLLTHNLLICARTASTNNNASRHLVVGLYVFVLDNVIAKWWDSAPVARESCQLLALVVECIQKVSQIYPEFLVPKMPRLIARIAAHWAVWNQQDLSDPVILWICQDYEKSKDFVAINVLSSTSILFNIWFDKEFRAKQTTSTVSAPASATVAPTLARVFDEYSSDKVKLDVLNASRGGDHVNAFIAIATMLTNRYNDATHNAITVATFLKTLRWVYSDSENAFPQGPTFCNAFVAYIDKAIGTRVS